MKFLQTTWMPTMILGLAVLLGGCDKMKDAVGIGGSSGSTRATAESIGQVRVVQLNAKSCRSSISSALAERGFSTSGSRKVDAILDVSVNHSGRNLDNIPSFGGVGNKASYTAKLRGADDKLLFSTSGSEGSITMEELCQDIGDNIGERMQDRKGG
ncbi:MAG: hypothetical protein ACRESV_08550 [Nevskiales bacterium]